MLPSYFDYIFVHLRQKVLLQPALSPKFLSTLGPNPVRARPEPDPKSPVRLTTLQETAKESFGIQVKLLLAHMFTTHKEGFKLSFLQLNVKQKAVNTNFYCLWFDRPGEPNSIPSLQWQKLYSFGQ